MRRLIVPFILGIGGCALLVSLGIWQLKRLDLKESHLAKIEARIGEEPVALPANPDQDADAFLPVTVRGDFDGTDLAVLTSIARVGAAYRLVAAFETSEGRRIMIDRGYVPVTDGRRTDFAKDVDVVGSLHWPDEVDGWTPEPDLQNRIWYGRDVAVMAKALNTEPLLIVARAPTSAEPVTIPIPVGTEGIPNNHLGYAIQWFGLATVWAGMTAFLIWRIHRRTV
jgi:surfeit locus 1 family protein